MSISSAFGNWAADRLPRGPVTERDVKFCRRAAFFTAAFAFITPFLVKAVFHEQHENFLKDKNVAQQKLAKEILETEVRQVKADSSLMVIDVKKAEIQAQQLWDKELDKREVAQAYNDLLAYTPSVGFGFFSLVFFGAALGHSERLRRQAVEAPAFDVGPV